MYIAFLLITEDFFSVGISEYIIKDGISIIIKMDIFQNK